MVWIFHISLFRTSTSYDAKLKIPGIRLEIHTSSISAPHPRMICLCIVLISMIHIRGSFY